MNKWRSILFLILVLFSQFNTAAQTRKVLFLGNSYTGVNNLPQVIKDLASSAGDNLVFDSYTPGGYQLIDHLADNTSRNKIMAGGWDYVVLQGQSQEPVTHSSDFHGAGFQLHQFITQYNPCSVTMLYMTWGYKNGDASNCPSFPMICTYEGMDSTIRNHYIDLAERIKAEVSPVSVIWKYLRQHHAGIELYQADESHPTAAGTFAAACAFYAMIFKKDPTMTSFNFGLNASQAAIIKNAAKSLVFENLNEWDFKRMPVSNFQFSIGSGLNEVRFNANTQGTTETIHWDFGDQTSSDISNPVHSYATDGNYTVTLTTTNCDLEGLHTSVTDTVIRFCSHTPTVFTKNPWVCVNDTLWTQAADSYQWYSSGQPIPETNQYLAHYNQYNISNFSVISSVNGCAELSTVFTGTPEWSGYFFDITPGADPCTGDTAIFSVLHMNGSLPGTETILWYKNGNLLTQMTNEDTLKITSGGVYECKVTDPTSQCPKDTTSYTMTYNCTVVGIPVISQEEFWSVFPNPAKGYISIKLKNNYRQELVEVYNAQGSLIRQIRVPGTTTINIQEWQDGLYFLRLKGRNLPAIKFIKQ